MPRKLSSAAAEQPARAQIPKEKRSSAAYVCKQVVQLYSFGMLNRPDRAQMRCRCVFPTLFFPVWSDMQLSQLLSGNSGRCFSQRAGSLLGFRKGDNVADGIAAGNDHQQPVEPKGQTAMRGAPSSRARSRKPNFSFASSSPMPSTSRTLDCRLF